MTRPVAAAGGLSLVAGVIWLPKANPAVGTVAAAATGGLALSFAED